jgi:hypothetical protein
MSRIGRKIQKLRKAEPAARHVRLYRWEIESAAYRSLSLYARCLLVELKALYNGANNGDLYLSVRDAARKLNTGMHQATTAFRQLVDRGFIKARQRGAFQWKQRQATCWLLTEYDCDVTGHRATKDFMQWRPENESRLPLRQQTVAARAADSRKIELSVAAPATDSLEIAAHAVAAPATQIIYHGTPSEKTESEPPSAPPWAPCTPIRGPRSAAQFGPWLVETANKLGVPPEHVANALRIGVDDIRRMTRTDHRGRGTYPWPATQRRKVEAALASWVPPDGSPTN